MNKFIAVKKSLVLLLVATEPDDASSVLERLCDHFSQATSGKPRLQWQLHGALAVDEGHDWRPWFRALGHGSTEAS